jgi:kynurenine formamidase
MQPHHRVIDLTHPINESTPTWEQEGGFTMKITLDYDDCTTSAQFREQCCAMPLGIGTHIDAPAHCVKGGLCVNELPLSQLMVPAVIIDVSPRATQDFIVTDNDLRSFEDAYGIIPQNSLAIIHTGWGKRWTSPLSYRNADHNGVLHFPSVSPDAADLLLARNVAGIGIDTLSPDTEGTGFPVHKKLLQAGKYIIENIANADLLPAIGTFAIILPLNIEKGTEAPVRMIGIVPQPNQ